MNKHKVEPLLHHSWTVHHSTAVSFCCNDEMFPCLSQAVEEDYRDANDSDSSLDSGSSSGPNFNYILNMPLWCLTKEKVEELLKQRDQKVFIIIIISVSPCSVHSDL